MASGQSLLMIQICKKLRILPGYEVFFCLITGILKTAAYDLLYLTIMNINTGSEFHPVPFRYRL